jgi:hypothetical protein
MPRSRFMVPPAVASLLLFAPPAAAHDLHLKAEKREGRLYIETWYEDDLPADGAKVKVLAGDATVSEGTTNDRGVWVTDCPPPGAFRIVATDTGHRAEIEFVVSSTDPIQRAGTTKEEVTERRWVGTVSGLGVLVVVVLVSRWLLRRSTAQHQV